MKVIEPHIHMRQVAGDKVRIIMKLMVQLDDNTIKSQVMHESSMIEVHHHYMNVLHKILPDLSPPELHWRFKFILGSLHAFMVEHHAPFQRDEISDEEIINCILTFLMAGLLAPPSIQKKD